MTVIVQSTKRPQPKRTCKECYKILEPHEKDPYADCTDFIKRYSKDTSHIRSMLDK